MTEDEETRRRRRAGGRQDGAGDTSEDPESGNFSDPRVRWPSETWRRTEQPGGEWPHSRTPGRGRAEPRAGEPPGLSKFGAGDDRSLLERPDDVIRADIREELDADSQCDATGIEIEVRDGVVVLEGQVPARPMKHRAAEIANGARAVRRVDNRLHVR